jgi:CRISPR-associated protein Cas2
MSDYRINAYHVMWIFVFFDLPVVTKAQRKKATKFRISLEKDGFVMMQFSVYIRHCPSRENMEVHIKRVKSFIPEEGKVSILHVTGKQYGDIINFNPDSRTKCKSFVLNSPIILTLET